jgi:hypothetical protein
LNENSPTNLETRVCNRNKNKSINFKTQRNKHIQFSFAKACRNSQIKIVIKNNVFIRPLKKSLLEKLLTKGIVLTRSEKKVFLNIFTFLKMHQNFELASSGLLTFLNISSDFRKQRFSFNTFTFCLLLVRKS